MHGSIQNQKEAKLPNSHKVTFFIKILYPLFIIFAPFIKEIGLDAQKLTIIA